MAITTFSPLSWPSWGVRFTGLLDSTSPSGKTLCASLRMTRVEKPVASRYLWATIRAYRAVSSGESITQFSRVASDARASPTDRAVAVSSRSRPAMPSVLVKLTQILRLGNSACISHNRVVFPSLELPVTTVWYTCIVTYLRHP